MKTLYIFLLLPIIALLDAGVASGQLIDPIRNIDKLSLKDRAAHSYLKTGHSSQLVNNYDLKYHRFQWLVDPAQLAIRGSVTSYYVSTDPFMSTIQFELAQEMSADSAFHRGFKVGLSHVGNLVTVSYGEIISNGTLDSVTIYYHGTPPGTGFGSFAIGMHNNKPALWTLSEPYGASEWWPSKNDLSDKIDSLDIFVAAPDIYKVASNGVLMGEAPYGSNLKVTWWKHKYPIASYLIAIAVTNYIVYTEHFNGPGGSFPVLNYVYPEDSMTCAAQTVQLLPVYELYGTLFGNYPYEHEKYGHAEFGWGGGMEHQTMTFIGQGAFNLEILSHELAHQWFGDLVTCGSWHDIWLNEGFATYCAGLMYEKLSPELYWPIWKRQNISWVTYYPDGSVYCEDTTNVNRIFDSRLSYSKGGMVLHQLRWVIGDSAFFTGMRNYLEDPDLRFGFALTNDYKEHMEATSGKDLTQYFDDWIYKEGYPSYQVIYSQDGFHNTSVTINQTQSHASVEFFHLPVPLKFYGQGSDTIVVLDNTFSGQVFTVNPGFVIDSVQFDPDYWLISANNHVALGLDDLPAGKAFSLFPNPCNEKLVASHNLGTIESVEVLDLSGKRISLDLQENNPDRLILSTNRLNNGIYLLCVTFDKGFIARKFLVMH
jgi:hypothetical protein